MKKFSLILLLIFSLFLFIGCNDKEDDGNETEDVLDILVNNITLKVDEEYEFYTTKNVNISSSDESIVLVNQDTLTIKGVSAGTATILITLKDNENVSHSVEVIVKKEETNEDKIEIVKKWLTETVVSDGRDVISLPTTHPTIGGKITWSTTSDLVDLDRGRLEMGEEDEIVDLNYELTLGGKTDNGTIAYTIIGFVSLDAKALFDNQFSTFKIKEDMDLITQFSDFGGTTITWESSNEEVFTNQGKFYQPYDDCDILITYTVKTTNPQTEHTWSKLFAVDGLSISEKSVAVVEWIDKNVGKSGVIDETTEFPTELEEFGATIEWINSEGNPFNFKDYEGNPILSGAINVSALITISGESIKINKTFQTTSSSLTNVWDKVELFVDQISKNSYNSAKKVLGNYYKHGYIPFFTQGRMAIVEDILTVNGTNRPGTLKTSTQYVVVHDTANTRSGAGARSQATYLKNGAEGRYVSWHYAIDDTECIQSVPNDEVAWHAGDGSRQWGSTYFNEDYHYQAITGGNANGIGIESCVNIDGDYAMTERNLAKLVAGLLIDYNLGFDRIKQHYDFAGKNCPNLLRTNGLWTRFIYLVQLEYYGLTALKDVTFKWEPISTNIDAKGLIDDTLTTGTVKYKVTATYQGVSRSYEKTINF